MKHAILIIGYQDFDFVMSNIEELDDDFYVFIHWDSRYPITKEQQEWVDSKPNVTLGQVFECNWGSFGIVKAEIWLCEQALKTDAQVFHLISDSDMMIPNVETFKEYWKDRKTSYMNYVKRDMKQDTSAWRSMAFYHRIDKYDYHHNEEDRELYKKEIEEQVQNKQYRELPDVELYSGSQWWSLQRDKIEYLVSQKDFIYKTWVDTRVPDEMFVQTVIMNGPEEVKKNIHNANKRFLMWIMKNGNCPAVLDTKDFRNIIHSWKTSNNLFVRKLRPSVSMDLIEVMKITHNNFDIVMQAVNEEFEENSYPTINTFFESGNS